MKKIFWIILCAACIQQGNAQFSVQYDSAVQKTTNFQYFKPEGNLFAGDCMPFYKDGTYYLYWLIDSAHHAALHGLGGHQWVLSTTKDLKNWVQHPVVLGIDADWEKSICTGSIVYHQNQYFAFYATRLLENGKINEQLSYAISPDGIRFKKQLPNPFFTSAPGYSKRNFRDPKVFVDSAGAFHLFISTQRDSVALKGLSGCLAHMVSTDLKHWTFLPPVITGQASVPECPDYFYWKGWHYLMYSDNSNTFYLKSKSPYGPWEEPDNQVFNEEFSNVVKCADFTNGRKIAASWIPNRLDNKDDNREVFGGNILLREVKQTGNGTLITSFPPELIPATGQSLSLPYTVEGKKQNSGNASFQISDADGVGSVRFEKVPANARIRFEIDPEGNDEEYGVYLKSTDQGTDGYKLAFQANNKLVRLGNTSILGVDGLDKKIRVDIIMKGSVIDVSVDNRRCIVNRMAEKSGDELWFFAKHGKVKFSSVQVAALRGE